MAKEVIALIALDANVNFYAEIERYVSWKLNKEAQLIKIGCASALNSCTSINATGKRIISFSERQTICSRCQSSQESLFANDLFLVEDLFEPEHQSFLENLKYILEETRSIKSVIDFEFAQLPVCRIAFFDYSILTKSNLATVLDDDLIVRFCNGVKDILILVQNLKKLLSKYTFDRVIYVNGNYSQNTIIRTIFQKNGARCYSIEPQVTSQQLFAQVSFFKDRLALTSEGLLAFSHPYGVIESEVGKLLKNFGARIDGADFNAYTSLAYEPSAGNDWIELESFFHRYSVIHAFFMSSEDELIPHMVTHDLSSSFSHGVAPPYENQIEFTKYFIEQAKNHPEVGFVIRMHPRMAVNKRNKFESEEHVRYKDLVESLELSPNLLILNGDSKVSSYYLINQSGLVIVAWSTIGVEAALMGKKVISVFPQYLMYPLAKFSKQPTNFPQMSSALFDQTDFGMINLYNFISWASNAYEAQFFPILARRGSAGVWRKFLAVILSCTKSKRLYRLIASIFGAVYGRQPLLNKMAAENTVLNDSEPLPFSKIDSMVEQYRLRIKNKLSNYRKGMNKITLTNNRFY